LEFGVIELFGPCFYSENLRQLKVMYIVAVLIYVRSNVNKVVYVQV